MNLLDEIYRLERLDQLIRLQVTGNPDELAETMQVSRRTAFRLIDALKEMGCPIFFNAYKNSYCYEYPIKLVIFKVEEKTFDN